MNIGGWGGVGSGAGVRAWAGEEKEIRPRHATNNAIRRRARRFVIVITPFVKLRTYFSGAMVVPYALNMP